MSSNLTGRFLCLSDFEAAAREQLPHDVYEYVDAGAGDEITKRDNEEAFNRIKLRPRVLRDVSRIDTGLSLFGQKMLTQFCWPLSHTNDCCILKVKSQPRAVVGQRAQSSFSAQLRRRRLKTALL